MLAQIPVAWEWLTAGWDKISEGSFGGQFAQALPKTLTAFSQQVGPSGVVKNPNVWYTDLILTPAKSNPTFFGYLVEFSEFGIGLILFLVIGYYLLGKKSIPAMLFWLVVVALIGGAFMNLNFYFAAGWPASGVSTRSLNIVMMLSQLAFVGYYLSTKGKLED